MMFAMRRSAYPRFRRHVIVLGNEKGGSGNRPPANAHCGRACSRGRPARRPPSISTSRQSSFNPTTSRTAAIGPSAPASRLESATSLTSVRGRVEGRIVEQNEAAEFASFAARDRRTVEAHA